MISGIWKRRAAAVLAFGVFCAVATARADEDGSGAGPGRAVRLSSVDGQVQVSQGDQVLADHAIANTPLFEGSQISTGDDGRAEIQFEDGSVARIPPDSSLTLTVLRAGGPTEVELDSGMGYFELQDGSHGDGDAASMRVRFQSSVVTVGGFTVLRVKLDEGPGELAVFSGNAHLDSTNGASMDLRAGQSVSLGSLTVADTIQQDSWDAWNNDRDQAMTAEDVGSTPATSDVPNGNSPAWSDLNANGIWYNVPDQGYVWSPYDASNPGWDPYGVGYWMATPGYGYMWVSGYPWGYMPYQCGAWSWYDGFGWGWAPGGCSPWWGGGGWVLNVANAPVWYRMPVRPHYPRPLPMRPGTRVINGGTHPPLGMRPVAPVVAVSRHESSPVAVLPARETNRPLKLGSVVAQPLRPAGGRTGEPANGYTHGPTWPSRERPVYRAPGGEDARPGYAPALRTEESRHGYTSAPPTTQRPAYAAPRQEQRSPAPSSRPSGGSAPHGGGGGGSHESGSHK